LIINQQQIAQLVETLSTLIHKHTDTPYES